MANKVVNGVFVWLLNSHPYNVQRANEWMHIGKN